MIIFMFASYISFSVSASLRFLYLPSSWLCVYESFWFDHHIFCVYQVGSLSNLSSRFIFSFRFSKILLFSYQIRLRNFAFLTKSTLLYSFNSLLLKIGLGYWFFKKAVLLLISVSRLFDEFRKINESLKGFTWLS